MFVPSPQIKINQSDEKELNIELKTEEININKLICGERTGAKELPEGGVVVLLDGGNFEFEEGVLAAVAVDAVDVVGSLDGQREDVAASRRDDENVIVLGKLKGLAVESGVLPRAVEYDLRGV